MSRPLRIVAIVAGALVALVAIGVAVVVSRFDAPTIVARAAAEASRATGRTIAVAGPVELDWWPRLALVAQGVTVANPPGASRPELARVAVVRGSVATWPLVWRREVIVDRVSVEGLDLALETIDGRGNWVFDAPAASSGAAPAGDGGARLGRIALAGPVDVKDAKVAFRPAPRAAPFTVAIPSFQVEPGADGQFAWNAALEHDGTRWTIAATSGDPIAAARGGVALPLDVKVEGGGVVLAAKGRAERRDSGPGIAVDASIAWKAGAPALARRSAELAASDGRLAGRVDADARRIEVDGLAGSWGGSNVDGTFTYVHAGPRPRLAGRLHADRIDLSRPAPPASPAAAGAAGAESAKGGAPLDRIAALDADVDFVIDRLALPGAVEATNARGRVLVAGGKLTADPLGADLGGGRLQARVTADAATDRARIVADAKGVELTRVAIREVAGRPASGGRTNASIDLAGPARSVAAFRAGASGTIRVDIGPARVEGVALDAGGEVFTRLADAINPFRRVDKVTELQCFVARLAVKDGIAAAERTIALESGRISASASGTIDLGRETLDLLVRPRARGGGLSPIPTVELAEVVRVTGPWRSPSVKLDKVAAARTAITVGGAAIASGGWSLLATPLLNAGGDPHPCATARAGGQVAAETAQGPAKDAPAVPADPVDALRKLFRR